METAGLGRAVDTLPGCPVLLAPRPPGRVLRSSPRRKGTSPSGGNGASWPQAGWRGPRGGLKCVLPPTGISLPERPLFTVTHLTAPFSVPSLGSCSGDKEQVAARGISPTPHPHRPGHLSSVWPPALWEETLGPAHTTLLPSLVPSSTFPWCCDIHLHACLPVLGAVWPGHPWVGGSGEGRAYLTAFQSFCCGCCSAVAPSPFHTIADYTMPNPQAQNLSGASSNLPLWPASLSALT